MLAHHTTTYRDLERLLPTVLSRKTERRTAAVDIGQIPGYSAARLVELDVGRGNGRAAP